MKFEWVKETKDGIDEWRCPFGPLVLRVSQRIVPMVHGIWMIQPSDHWRWAIYNTGDAAHKNKPTTVAVDRSEGGFESDQLAKETVEREAEQFAMAVFAPLVESASNACWRRHDNASEQSDLMRMREPLLTAISWDQPFVGSTIETYLHVSRERALTEDERWHFKALQEWDKRKSALFFRIVRSTSFEWFVEEAAALGRPPKPRTEVPPRPSRVRHEHERVLEQFEKLASVFSDVLTVKAALASLAATKNRSSEAQAEPELDDWVSDVVSKVAAAMVRSVTDDAPPAIPQRGKP